MMESPWVAIFGRLVQRHIKTLDDVPAQLRPAVAAWLENNR